MTEPFVNWARTVRSTPSAWHRPRTEAEVVALVTRAHAEGRRVRVVGSRHSWSAVAAPDDLALDLSGLDRFLAVDPEAGTVTVEAGVRLQTLCDVLANHGLALPVVGSILEQTVAGATATGTHGSSRREGNLSRGIRAMRLVTGTGDVLDLEPEDADGRLDAARVHLGALGVVTRLTLAVVPAFRLEERRQRLPFDLAADRLLALADAHAFCKLWWLPHTRDALVVTCQRTDEPGEPSALARRLDAVVNRSVFPAMLALGGRVPALVPWQNRLVDRVHFTEGRRVGRSDRVLTLVMPPRHRETELAVDARHTPRLLREVRDLLSALQARLDFIVEARFVAADSGWMSPAHGRDTLQLGVYGAATPDLDRVFDGFQALGTALDARPHWGKETDVSWEDTRRLWPQAESFRALAEVLDPGGVFRSPFVDRVLGRG